MPELRNAMIESVEQFRRLLLAVRQVREEPGMDYVETVIGRHVRHVIDHVQAFAEGLTTGVIDYNRRSRGSDIETSLELGLSELERLAHWLDGAALDDLPVEVVSEISVVETTSLRFASYIHREALYLINHSIHHAAYAALLARGAGIGCDTLLGIAPATATFMRQEEPANG